MPLAHSGIHYVHWRIPYGRGWTEEREHGYASVRLWNGGYKSAHMSGISFPPNIHSMSPYTKYIHG